MSVRYNVCKGRVCVGGNERLRYRIEVPCVEGCPRLNEFYQSLAERCEAFCREKLCKHSYGKRCVYQMLCRVSSAHSELLSVVSRVRMYVGGEVLQEYAWVRNWSKKEDCMLPKRIFLKMLPRQARPKLKSERGGDPFLLGDGLQCLGAANIDKLFK